MKKSIYRILLMAAGALQLLFFFILPYATLSEMMGALSGLAQGLGMGDMYPKNLTGLAAVKMLSAMPDYGVIMVFVFVPPVVMGVLVLLMNLFGKKRLSYVGSIIFSFLMVNFYGFAAFMVSLLADAGYKTSLGGAVCVILSIAMFVISIIGSVKDGKPAAETAGAASTGAAKAKPGKSVKPGKKDGTVTGLSGAYAGAVIPVKSGDTVTIGRDPSVCSIVTKGEKVSRKHCTVTFNGDNGMYTVTDFSSNGTFDGEGNRLARTAATPMAAGSVITVGEDKFRLG